ncbi:MAG: deoxyribodipyrimidine photo-lyase [Thermoplasmatota archaeon]
MIREEQVKKLNEAEGRSGDLVLYWMQASQRTEQNHALEFAIEKADEEDQPLVVLFCLIDDFPDANKRHYKFMLEGLKEVYESLKERDIRFVVKNGAPEDIVPNISDEASLLVTDRDYLKLQRSWRENIVKNVDIPFYQIESNVVVPVETTSDKEEYAARTIRPKINGQKDEFHNIIDERTPKKGSLDLDFEGLDISDIDQCMKKLNLQGDVKPVDSFKGGTSAAKSLLKDFIKNKLDDYPELSNDPSADNLSKMSPYLHFGQISPVYIADEVIRSGSDGGEDYLEELLIRRELSMNYIFYNDNYDSLEGLPDWAMKTLKEHEKDEREYVYSMKEFEKAETHDPYWNAAQKEMVKTGKMHGYMRMYWGKKILEWSKTPEDAFQKAIELNNKYELDGRDANAFTGVAWCFGKHDRAWKEREIFGKVRYMNANGLKRKFDAEAYVEEIEKI